MTSEAKYQYAMCSIVNDPEKVNTTLHDWGNDGWELVSGSVGTAHMHTVYALYWRKPIAGNPEPTSV
jgi:hypothetical protein